MSALEILCRHAARSLPDSLPQRKAVLRALQTSLSPRHDLHQRVRAQLAAIRAVEKLNTELQTRCNELEIP